MSESLFERTSFKLDAMLNVTKIGVEFIPGPKMYFFFEKCMRG